MVSKFTDWAEERMRKALISAENTVNGSAELPRKLFDVELDANSYIEIPQILGWRLQFIPSAGDFAGQVISRVFVVPGGTLGAAKKVCHIRYGEHAHILAGFSLSEDSHFGVWDG